MAQDSAVNTRSTLSSLTEEDDEGTVVGARGDFPLAERVSAVRVVGAYAIEVTFCDGAQRVVSLEPEIDRLAVLSRLSDPAYFRQARYDPDVRTVTWPEGEDLAPEFLRWGHHGPDCPCGR